MKRIILCLFIVHSSISLISQVPLIQKGLVREQNSGKRTIDGVQIIYSNAVPTNSDGVGKFSLSFKDKKAGDIVFLTEIFKKGYELVNEKELENVKLSSSELFGADIILAKKGVLDAAKKEYYAISDNALKAGFEKQKTKLKIELNKLRLSEKQYQEQFELLQTQFENQKRELDHLSEKFAKVNFDDVSFLYKEALQLFKEGKIDEAIKKLEGADIIGRTDKRFKERDRIAIEIMINEKGVQEDIKLLKLQADLYSLKFEINNAEALYERMFLLDSSNLNILRDVANFFQVNHRYEKTLQIIPKIIKHPFAEEWQKGNAYNSLGYIYSILGDLNNALVAYTKGYGIYNQLSKNNPKNLFYIRNLTICYSNFGKTHISLGNIDTALKFFEQHYRLSKELLIVFQSNLDFKYNLATSYQELGITHNTLGNLNTALMFFEEMFKLINELYSNQPTNLSFKLGLAASYSNLGNIYISLGELNKALKFNEEYNTISKELYEALPSNIEFKYNLAISYEKLGRSYNRLGNLDKALENYEKQNKVIKELNIDFQSNVLFKKNLATSYSKLGDIHTFLGNIDKALHNYAEDFKLSNELYTAHPKNVDFKNGLVISYEKLGVTQSSLGNKDTAIDLYEESNRLSKELYTAHPKNVDFKNGLAISYERLGDIHTFLGNKDKALGFYIERNRLGKELYVTYPENVNFKNGLAISCSKLGDMRSNLGNLESAFLLYEESNRLIKELYDANPTNVEFKNGLAISYYKLGEFSRDKLKNKTKAEMYFSQTEALWLELVRDAPQYIDFQKSLSNIKRIIKYLENE